MTTVSLSLPWPPTFNTYWRHVGKRVLISANGKAYRKRVGEAVMLARYRNEIARAPLTGLLAVRIEVQPPDAVTRDLDNMLKAPLDALTKAGFWIDDGQIDELTIVRMSPVKGGAFRLVVTELQACNAA